MCHEMSRQTRLKARRIGITIINKGSIRLPLKRSLKFVRLNPMSKDNFYFSYRMSLVELKVIIKQLDDMLREEFINLFIRFYRMNFYR